MRLEAPSTLYNDETDRATSERRWNVSFIFQNPKVHIQSEVNIEGPLIAQALQDRNGFYVRL